MRDLAVIERDAASMICHVYGCRKDEIAPWSLWLPLAAGQTHYQHYTHAPFVVYDVELVGRGRVPGDYVELNVRCNRTRLYRFNERFERAPFLVDRTHVVGVNRQRHVGPVAVALHAFAPAGHMDTGDTDQQLLEQLELERLGMWEPPDAAPASIAPSTAETLKPHAVRFHPYDHDDQVRRAAALMGCG